ncbi:unnamed protein product [Adineta steineri]|uniref:PLAT domain-containing protein n=1 Tax=Adineta steineri TaxID=433720 RepID=A0A815PK22_9BILA|nr:unnamed protein product [Adineta steineri]CAF1449872.1 unnamed protein product [Adineta steineri]CAF3885832.1 unnamed protein product [Adineta steineri]CAF3955646.1 unnamed protein product [Adineta steineri]
MDDRRDLIKTRGHSCFEWIQLIATISIPIIIAIYTILENKSNISIAAANSRKDIEIANNYQRSESELAQQSQQKDRDLAHDQQQEDILVKYQTFLASLILERGEDLQKSSNTQNVLRFMTLTALNQLDIRRKDILIRSLHDAKLINFRENTNKNHPSILELASVNLKDITLGSPRNSPDEYPLHHYIPWEYLWLPDVILTNASFRHTRLQCATFTRARMDLVDLSFTNQPITKCFDEFPDAGTDFISTSLVNANFRNSKFRYTDFSRANLTFANMRGFSCQMCTFSHTILFQADLSFSYFYHSFLLNQSLLDFTGIKLKQATIYGSYFRSIDFQNADLSNAQLSQVTIRNSVFIKATLKNCSFIKSIIQESIFQNTTLNKIDFSNAILYNVTFNNSDMSNANLSFIKCVYCIFTNVKLEDTIFNNASLRYSKFINCSINMSQLDEAVDLFGSTLSNGTAPLTLGTEGQYSKKTIYNIRIQTGDEFQAETDADVYLQIFGEKNSTDKIQLEPVDYTPKKFQRGQINEFTYEFDDLGKIESVIIGHNEENPGAGWFLDWVEIDISMRSEIYRFPCYRWLDTDKDDGEIVRQLTLSGVSETPVYVVLYKITVVTGDKDRSGTDANVFLTIYGDKSDSGEQQLNQSKTNKNPFEQTETDVFDLYLISLGRLRKINIRHDNKGWGPGWYLFKIEIDDSKTHQKYHFPHDRWLSKDKGDSQISREIYALESRQFDLPITSKTISPLSVNYDEQIKALYTTYQIRVVTSDDKFHGDTNTNVYIVIFGESSHTDQIPLTISKTYKNPFKKGQTDLFEIETIDIGQPTKIKIGHANLGLLSDWLLDRVEIYISKLDRTWIFPCGRWLRNTTKESQLEIELFPNIHNK